MPGHWICDRCGYDGDHAEWCAYNRPADEQWKGHMTKEEVAELKRKKECKGGPTKAKPDQPYCKPDQSCCDFTCGN